MNKDQINLLIEKIAAAKTILIFGHKNPDGDALGATLGLAHLIRDNFGKSADVIYDGNLPFKYDFAPGRDKMVYVEKISQKKYDLCIALDSPTPKQVGDAQMAFFNGATDTIKIDHHKTGGDNDFANLNITQTDFAAAAEIIYEIARDANWTISADAANCLYLGLYTDTGGFSYIDNGNAMRAAADLVDLGANPRIVGPNLDALTRDDILAEAVSLANTEFFHNGKLAIVPVLHTQYKRLDSGDTSILWRARNILGVKVAVIIKEARQNKVHASFRSETVPVRPVAEKLGGGGHDMAAAANLEMTLDEAKKIIVSEFKDLV